MTRPDDRPQFLARDSYRLRRMMDAVRFLPVVGLVLLLLPLMREGAATDSPAIGREAVYLFLVWGGLALAALLLSLGLRRALDPPQEGRDPAAPDPED